MDSPQIKQMDTDETRLKALSEKIIGCCFKVHNALGAGFAEAVYENSLVHELRKAGLFVEPQVPIEVRYDGVVVGQYFADLIVERTILIECKAVRNFDDGHVAQCLNYLAATALPLCLLINFGRRVEIKRFRGRQHY